MRMRVGALLPESPIRLSPPRFEPLRRLAGTNRRKSRRFGRGGGYPGLSLSFAVMPAVSSMPMPTDQARAGVGAQAAPHLQQLHLDRHHPSRLPHPRRGYVQPSSDLVFVYLQ